MMRKIPLELYVHIPFCVRKCAYCDFVSGPASSLEKRAYTEALMKEIRLAAGTPALRPEDYRVISVFLGGGTPSVIEESYIGEILSCIRSEFQMGEKTEITLEANPGTLTEEKLESYRRAGINRLSIGLQSAEERELKLLGRIHTFPEFEESYRMARKAGFGNISVDLMAALPGQTESDFKKTLETVVHLKPVPPEHISVYSLIIEEGTPFYEVYHGREDVLLPSEETERAMYYGCRDFLEENGYYRYEISNFAKDGFECLHNKGYWTGIEYLGFGISASSYINGQRFTNIADRNAYVEILNGEQGRDVLKRIREPEEIVTEKRAMEEFMFLGLRMMEGVSEETFEKRFGKTMEEIYGQVLRKMERRGLMEKSASWKLTDAGVDVSNYVMAEFLLD